MRISENLTNFRMINRAIEVYPHMHMLYGVRSGLFLSADMTTEALQDAVKGEVSWKFPEYFVGNFENL